MTPDERERWLDDHSKVGGTSLYYHRDGRPARNNREAMTIMGGMYSDPSSPDFFRVAETDVNGSRISTVFLCINHAFGKGEPIIFESMVFGGPLADAGDRYSTEEEARQGHQNLVERVMEAQPRSRVLAFFEYIADWWVTVWRRAFGRD